jgi:hypothetical protein
MKSMTRALLAGSALACLAVVGMTGTAHAASGRLTLTSGTGSVTVFYDACQPPRSYQPQLYVVDTFDNQPASGCQAVLINRAGASTVLCVGRGSVPTEFRQAPRVVIQPGIAPTCGFDSTGSTDPTVGT